MSEIKIAGIVEEVDAGLDCARAGRVRSMVAISVATPPRPLNPAVSGGSDAECEGCEVRSLQK